MTFELFPEHQNAGKETIGPRSVVLRGYALPYVDDVLAAVAAMEQAAAFRNMVTPGGYSMSAAMSNCGQWGWTTDRHGYRYTQHDPLTDRPWPAMPEPFTRLAEDAASAAGFPDFHPDACLMNRYLAGSKMSLHQDKNERDFNAPIVSVSLGMPAIFLFGGQNRNDRPARISLLHGDVVVWGGVDRLRYHGILPLKELPHPLLGSQRINLTFRKAGA